ncbi:MAG: glycoside-pentoside-hexuronide (GPH):cation symporter [Muribaculaceae bacterium]|nr:glycoside-pentoside-hexuronide (GPH):cation symporter [Muribaculaceae bacterium]
MPKLLKRKIGYGLGDMASSMFWKIFSYYLPFFYSNVFGLSLIDAGILVMVTRLWDAVSDPMMGVVADRTDTRMGKYRPYLLWFALPFAVCGVLLFTTPDTSYAGKLIWAYITYILMMTVYTGINVPYGAMLGVITDSPEQKTVFSSFRMLFAYAGSFVALAAWEPMCTFFSSTLGMTEAGAWQWAMIVIAIACLALFLFCFALTREVVHTRSVVSVGSDFKALLKNRPWWILIGAALSFNMFSTVRGATVAYFFADVIGADAHMWLFGLSVLFYSGLFLSVGEVANMAGVALAVPVVRRMGKKPAFMAVNALLVVLSVMFFFLPVSAAGFFLMLVFQVLISVLTGIMSPLVWSMYADVADYSEHRFHTASTGLIFSSSSMAQKFGGAIGGAAVLWLLDACGYVTASGGAAALQPGSAITCLWTLMTFIPAGVAVVAIVAAWFYPLDTARVRVIADELRVRRAAPASTLGQTEKEAAKNFAQINA